MSAGPETDDEEEWRFSLEEIDARQENGEQANGNQGGNVTGSLEGAGPLEPGDIDLENAIFVALGALLVVGLIAAVYLGL